MPDTGNIKRSCRHNRSSKRASTDALSAAAADKHVSRRWCSERLGSLTHRYDDSNAYLTLPLLLCVLNIKATSTEAEAALARRQLDIYIKVLKTQQKLYDGTDYVFDIIDNIHKYADEERVGLLLEHGNEGSSGTKTPTSSAISAPPRPVKQSFAWHGLLLRKPRLYLRLVSTTPLS